MKDKELTTPVAIVGGGPVGLLLALYLDFYGVKCTIFNTEPNERWHPKGNGQNARTMEHYRQLGFSDDIRTLGLPDDHPFDQAYFTRLSKHEIYRFPMPSRVERIAMRRQMPVDDQMPEPMYHVNLAGAVVHPGRKRSQDPRWQNRRFGQSDLGDVLCSRMRRRPQSHPQDVRYWLRRGCSKEGCVLVRAIFLGLYAHS